MKHYQKKHRTGDRHSYAKLTRFLPEPILTDFERVNLEPKPKLGVSGKVIPQSDIKKKIASMWG